MYEATRQRIGEIIGEASMCWSETPKGIFNSDKASELIDEVMTHIQYPLKHPEDKKDKWENQLDKKIKENYFVTPDSHLNVSGIKSFISQALTAERKELREKVVRLKEPYKHEECLEGKQEICEICLDIASQNYVLEKVLALIKE